MSIPDGTTGTIVNGEERETIRFHKVAEGEHGATYSMQPTAAPIPVDRPDVAADSSGWFGRARGYLADAPAIFPPWLKRWPEFWQATRLTWSYTWRFTAFHTVRAPVYVMRLIVRSPRGSCRLVRRWFAWVVDSESRPVAAQAAAAGDVTEWSTFVTRHSKRVGPRRITSAVVGGVVLVGGLVAWFLVPDWALTCGTLATLALLGLAGGSDRPLITRYVSVHTMRPLTSIEVLDALDAIGFGGRKGKDGARFAAEVQRDGPGWRAEVDLPKGIKSAAVLEKREELAAAMRRPIATVWPEGDRAAHPGRLVLWIAAQDPAKAPRRLWPLMAKGTADVFEALPFGFDPRGNLVTIRLMYSNLLVGGIPGSGKTSAALAIVLGVALDPTAQLWIYELKGSGDLNSVKPICHVYVSGDEDEDLAACNAGLSWAIAEQQRRAKFVKSLPADQVPDGRRITRELVDRYPEQNLGPIVIVIDEAQELFTHPEFKDDAETRAKKAAKKFRAYGMILILLTQNPDAPSLPSGVSAQFGTRFCLAVMEWRANNNVLGTGAHERGLRATDISIDEQGTGILARGREGSTVRAAFIKQTEADQVAARALALRTAAGNLTGQAVGEDVDTGTVETVVDHLHGIWPDGTDAVHSHRLVPALAARWPDVYGPWLDEEDPAARSTQLANALRPYRVKTVTINLRGCCGAARGVRFCDLPTDIASPDEEPE